jgi:hypothetical protein
VVSPFLAVLVPRGTITSDSRLQAAYGSKKGTSTGDTRLKLPEDVKLLPTATTPNQRLNNHNNCLCVVFRLGV